MYLKAFNFYLFKSTWSSFGSFVDWQDLAKILQSPAKFWNLLWPFLQISANFFAANGGQIFSKLSRYDFLMKKPTYSLITNNAPQNYLLQGELEHAGACRTKRVLDLNILFIKNFFEFDFSGRPFYAKTLYSNFLIWGPLTQSMALGLRAA